MDRRDARAARLRMWPGVWAALLLAALPARAERVRLLATDREAAEARVEAVLGARSEVLVSAFIFGDDPFTLTGLALLRDAARRHVAVRVLVDAQWNGVPRPVLAHLLAEGIEIREYHPFRLDRLSWILRRMHDKLTVVDGGRVIAGGRNVESPYYGFGRQVARRNYLDLDLEAEGAVAAGARDYFLRLWQSRHVRPVAARASPAELREAALRLDQYQRWLDERIAAARADPERRAPAFVETGAVRFLHDPVGDHDGASAVGRELRDLLGSARASVLIESPYLIPTRALRRSLRDAVARGVRVRILTNSLATSDNLLAQAGYVGDRRFLVEEGIELWEYSGPECLHAKAAVVDGETVVVGSYNLDPRSEHLNSELALVVADRALAANLTELFDRHLERAWPIARHGWPKGATKPYPGVSGWKVFRLEMLRLLVPLFEGQL